MNNESPSPATADDSVTTSSRVQARKRKKHIELLDSLLRSLDVLIFIELSAVYYSDCTALLLFLRTTVQVFFLTPRIPASTPARPHLSAILGSNIFCFALHILRARPEGGENNRGYLNGGLLIDFVGHPGPVSKWKLVAMDLLIAALQIIMLAVTVERLTIKEPSSNISNPTTATTSAPDSDADLRRAEEGQISEVAEDEEGVELQELLAEPDRDPTAERASHPLDSFYTGRTMLLELDVLNIMRRLGPATANPNSTDATTTMLGGVIGVRFRLRGQT